MLRKTLGVVLAIMIALTGCTQYIFPEDWWPPRPNDKPSSGELTPEEIAKGIDFEQLNEDISAELVGTDVPGILVTASTNNPASSMVYSNIGARNTSEKIYIDVVFEASGYRNSATTLISGGRMILTAMGDSNNSPIELSTYTAKTVEALETSTTIGNQTVSESVEITITTPSVIEGTVNVSSDSVVFTDLKIETPSSNFGATITVGNIEIPINQVINDITEGYNGLFDGGYGTESNPYEIRTTQQFLNIGDENFQEMLLEGDNEDLFFELTGDIDLRGHSGYVGTVFSGTLDGNNHTITGSNSIHHIFRYNYEDVEFDDINIVFDDESVTLLVQYPGFKSDVKLGNESYQYDKDSMRLLFNDVDYSSPANNMDYYYSVRDNNFAFYADGSVTASETYFDGDFELSWTTTAYTENNERINYIVTIDECDVTGNFIGGFSNSGSAIFVGGQYGDTEIAVRNSSFTGELTGYNTALLVANSNLCIPGKNGVTDTNFTIENVICNGIIESYSNNGSVYFSNSKEFEGAFAGTLNESPYQPLSSANALEISDVSDNKFNSNNKLSIINPEVAIGTEAFQFKLSLPSVFWYANPLDNSPVSSTDSNTFTVEYSANEEPANVYAAMPITRREADILSSEVPEFATIDWNNANISAEGNPYSFVQVNDDWYLVIDYVSNEDLMYSKTGIPSSLSGYKYMTRVIALALDHNNEVIATSAQLILSE